MRQFAWYSPEFDVIVLQWFMEECYISFEWDPEELYKIISSKFGVEEELMSKTLWFPLGEL